MGHYNFLIRNSYSQGSDNTAKIVSGFSLEMNDYWLGFRASPEGCLPPGPTAGAGWGRPGGAPPARSARRRPGGSSAAWLARWCFYCSDHETENVRQRRYIQYRMRFASGFYRCFNSVVRQN
jgi:hypothetical protein